MVYGIIPSKFVIILICSNCIMRTINKRIEFNNNEKGKHDEKENDSKYF